MSEDLAGGWAGLGWPWSFFKCFEDERKLSPARK